MKGLSGQSPSPRMIRAKCSSISMEGKESHFLQEVVSEPIADDVGSAHKILSKSPANDFDNN